MFMIFLVIFWQVYNIKQIEKYEKEDIKLVFFIFYDSKVVIYQIKELS